MNFKLKSLAVTIGLATGSISFTTYATPITSTSQTVSINTTVTTSVDVTYNGAFSSDHDGPGTAQTSQANLNSGGSTPWYFGDAQGTASGTNTGVSSLSTKASGAKSTAVSNVHQVATIKNNTSAAQNFSFDFLINGGWLTTSIINYEFGAGHYENAAYSATILVNGLTVWNSSANLNFDSTGYKLTKNGVDLGYSISDMGHWVGAFWGDYNGHINLGSFASGQTFKLDYLLTTSSRSDLNPLEVDSGYGAFANFGDPWSFNESPIDNDTIQIDVPTTEVPEPAGLALLGAGLLGLAYRRRAKKTV